MNKPILSLLVAAAIAQMGTAKAAPVLLATGSLTGVSDLSGLTGNLESGLSADVLGGLGSGLAWAGGNTFLALPDRGPNATTYTGGAPVDNTTSYISRFHTVSMSLTATPSGTLPFSLTPTLTGTTLLYSPTALTYGTTAGLPSAIPSINTSNKFYFTGRSDGFGVGNSLNGNNARLDPEGIRVSADGLSVFISDEYGPYVYQFNRITGERVKTFTLPSNLAAPNLSSSGAAEISGNTTGRVANKGMEGLAISPDGTKLIGFMQSPLIQDGGDGGRMNRIVTIDIATGETHQYAYDNQIADTGNKNYNSSEIVAINDHEFMILERDGKGLGDGSSAVVKRIYKVDISGATDVSSMSGASTLQPYALTKTLVLDIKAALNANGITNTNVPAKIEGLSFGEDIVINGQTLHTLWVNNDNDFLPDVAGPNKFYVFGLTDTDLSTTNFVNQSIAQTQSPVPVPSAVWLLLSGLGGLGVLGRTKKFSK